MGGKGIGSAEKGSRRKSLTWGGPFWYGETRKLAQRRLKNQGWGDVRGKKLPPKGGGDGKDFSLALPLSRGSGLMGLAEKNPSSLAGGSVRRTEGNTGKIGGVKNLDVRMASSSLGR